MENIIFPDNQKIKQFFEAIIPFRFLSNKEYGFLLDSVKAVFYKKSSCIIARGSEKGYKVFLIYTGLVKTFSKVDPGQTINRYIKKGHYFGIRSVLFNRSADYDYIADEDTLCFEIAAEKFIKLIKESRSFAQSLGNILRDEQGIFAAFERFNIELMRGVNFGGIDIDKLLTLYKKLDPALHPGAVSTKIDFSALFYAVRRLPENVTGTFSYLLTDSLPTEFTTPDNIFRVILSPARRRNIWEMLPGRDMVLLRGGLSDLIDFVTCLCLYAVEAAKIRRLLHNPEIILNLSAFINSLSDPEQKSSDLAEIVPFSLEEIEGIKMIWPKNPEVRLHQIALHSESISIKIRRQIHNYGSRRTELWTHQIGDAAKELTGFYPETLPDNVDVHIISSNTHSITNCLNPFYINNIDKIVGWGEKTNHLCLKEPWQNKYDSMYALSRDFFKANPDMILKMKKEADNGIMRLEKTVSTGIEVQLIDINKLKGHSIDPGIVPIDKNSNILIVNIDYAFGEQAEETILNLIMLFGKRISSINILGKAGSLVGKRGGILIPTAFIEQKIDLFYPISNSLNMDILKKYTSSLNTYTGPMLTVSGTLLQNSMMLHFYRNIWDCIGLEMEGVYYSRQIMESSQLGVLSADTDLRFLYYISDLPLDTTSRLSAPLEVYEGIPPLYAITRFILSEIFKYGNKKIIGAAK